ncbi:prolyl oligopeptidase family serine peptidase [Kitasatospora sp. NPDC058046]|uniref:prolyl oligopeptidase family serine peptidase n=1 Tax=Kitasatospora sp. NPDC058046 TaxID=3346312 RepID=UPI0036DABCBB
MTTAPDEASSPYAWLEDGASAQVADWSASQQRLCADLLAGLPDRSRLRTELARLHAYDTVTAPVWRARTEFFASRDTNGTRYAVFRRDRSVTGAEPVRLFDSTTRNRESGQLVTGWHVSPGGRAVVVELAERGQENSRLLLIDTATGTERPVPLDGYSTGSLAWHADDAFFFVRTDGPRPELCWLDTRDLGVRQVLVEGADPEARRLSIATSRDGRWLCLFQYAVDGTVTQYVGASADATAGRLVPTLRSRGSRVLARFSSDGRLFHCTSADIASGKIHIHDPARLRNRTVPLPLPPGEHLLGFLPLPVPGPASGDTLVAKTGTATGIHLRLCQGNRTTVLSATDRLYSIGGLTTDPLRPGHLWYTATSYDRPPAVHHLDLTGRQAHLHQPTSRSDDAPDVEQIATGVESFDGTRIPLTLLGRPGLLRRAAPTILFVYGGFRTALVPRYMAAPNLWIAAGGTYAVAHVRGGGELGADWHRAGTGDGKAVSVRDYLSAAHWLLNHGICLPGRLAGEGESNGGLVVASAVTREPGLFAAALITSPVTDLLRFHLSGAGRNWTAEYGNPDDPADREVLLRQSPLHNVRPGVRYPAAMISFWSGDRRVDPLHSRKFCAALQDAGDGTRPTILHNALGAGHGARATADGESLAADRLAFAARWTGLDLAAALARHPG